MSDLFFINTESREAARWLIDVSKSSICWSNRSAKALFSTEISKDRLLNSQLKNALIDKVQALTSLSPEREENLCWVIKCQDGRVLQCIGHRVHLGPGHLGVKVEAREMTSLVDMGSGQTIGSVDDEPYAHLDAFNLSYFRFDITGKCLRQSAQALTQFENVEEFKDLFAVSAMAPSVFGQLLTKGRISTDVRFLTKTGIHWCHIEGYKESAGDSFYLQVTDKQDIRLAEAELYRLKNYDSLTRLPNRESLYLKLDSQIAKVAQKDQSFGLLFIDLDGFKTVNDSFGHQVGDELLCGVARRIQGVLPRNTQLFRLGGDEFAILVEDILNDSNLIEVAQDVVSVSAQPYPVEDLEMLVTASVGISKYPDHGKSIDDLLKTSASAMCRSKALGYNNFCLYDNGMKQDYRAQLTLGGALRKAIEEEQFELYYQPKIRLSDELTVGAEALIRWIHPEHGMIPPDKFIPIAEETGLILPLGEWVIKRACHQLKEWREAGHPPISLSVNLSGRQFMQSDLVEMVRATLAETGVDPKYLELELTESMLMADAQQTIEKLHGFRKLGLTLSIDDFGTGYSSLAYLKKFPIQTLKIDRSFVSDLGIDADDDAIVKATIAMANSLNLKVIAEGVESRSQIDVLNDYQCEEVQGYLFAKPMNNIDFSSYLSAQSQNQYDLLAPVH
ncbi:EAL domain-containing protein [Marinomonas mediterranea]|uniref:putative bifunctional diguanylate cyclase/phosphodiesterase n=1 Tax=Marinomonas mediterranea TaxID=119864 RepID=UPI00234979F8|nr:bifunctional diguanylate cyclase/phosphodiesterase [Marinomonas mediterranea]WCN13767.1 EAL domain-containing protein [Marinomonas mediterranea]